MMSLYFKIPFPENLPDETWMEKCRQLEWLAEKKMLGIKLSL